MYSVYNIINDDKKSFMTVFLELQKSTKLFLKLSCVREIYRNVFPNLLWKRNPTYSYSACSYSGDAISLGLFIHQGRERKYRKTFLVNFFLPQNCPIFCIWPSIYLFNNAFMFFVFFCWFTWVFEKNEAKISKNHWMGVLKRNEKPHSVTNTINYNSVTCLSVANQQTFFTS